MSFDARQFRIFTAETLDRYVLTFGTGFNSPGSVELLLGTAAQESAFGTYLRQKGGGPAFGAFQMEEPTYRWLTGKFGAKASFLDWSFEELEWNLQRAVVMARLLYRAYPEPIPELGDIEGMARLWKLRYNTPKGAGRVEQFIKNYHRYVTGG
jgi:hypothetical protein